jgi:hypothetical protein
MIITVVFGDRISLAYEVGRGIVMSEEAASKIVNDIVDDPDIASEFLTHSLRVQNVWLEKLGCIIFIHSSNLRKHKP